MKRWYWFYVWVPFYGGERYIGKCEATEAEVRAAFPCRIDEDGAVHITGRPRGER